MNKFKKALALICCAVLLVCISVGATLAYLISNPDEVKNTFTVGDIEITLDEAKVDEYGKFVTDHENRVYANEYKLLPGHTYIKDPTVHVAPQSEESYIRMIVTISKIDKVKEIIGAAKPESVITKDGNTYFLPQYLVDGWKDKIWISTGKITEANNVATYEFRYHKTVNTLDIPENGDPLDLDDLFTHIIVPENIDNEALADLADMEIIIDAHAIQADGFVADTEKGLSAEDVAWAAFDEQVKE